MSIIGVETRLMYIISQIDGINASYSFEPKKLMSLPAITLQYLNLEQARHKFGGRIATYTFLMRLYCGMDQSEEEGFHQLKQLIDQILFAFNQKHEADLQMTVLRQNITTGNLVVNIDSQSPLYIHEFTLSVAEEL